jgi:hypothetical protein
MPSILLNIDSVIDNTADIPEIWNEKLKKILMVMLSGRSMSGRSMSGRAINF